MIEAKEYYGLLEMFERQHNLKPSDREKDKEIWKKGYTYSNGEINKLFKAFESGYSFAKHLFKES